MYRFGFQIFKYLLRNIFPYFLISWILLSVILFVQQSTRFTDIFFNINIPKRLIFELTFALVPSVISFTCPMAVLIGVIIGLSKMRSDSELTAIRATGVGNLQIAGPFFLLGLLLSGFAIFINTKGVPMAAGIVRGVALQTALLKLESPIEPGTFNSEINGSTIYVKNGNIETGVWENIFIHTEDKNQNIARLITARSGRIDSKFDESGEFAELVLSEAFVMTIPLEQKLDSDVNSPKPANNGPEKKFNAEKIGQIRFSIKTRRDELVKKLVSTQETPEEMGLGELAELIKTSEGKEKVEAQILWQRRLLLSVTPLVFAILGTVLVLRFNRGGRGFGLVLALISLISYYLLTLFSEQLIRTGRINPIFAGFMPILASVLVIGVFYRQGNSLRERLFRTIGSPFKGTDKTESRKTSAKNLYLDLTTGIRDFDIFINLVKYFVLTITFLTAVYLIFTAFELWKFAGTIDNGVFLLIKYLVYLLPYVYLQIAPAALMIAALATFVIKARNNELVAWTAAGQSIYRTFLPCFGFMFVAGLLNFGIQERIAPNTNRIQDQLRSQIRNRGVLTKKDGKIWVANQNRIISFEAETNGGGQKTAAGKVYVYDFEADEPFLKNVYLAERAGWSQGNLILERGEKIVSVGAEQVKIEAFSNLRLEERQNPFESIVEKPSHLAIGATSEKISETESLTERRNLEIALQKKYAVVFLPIILTLFTIPFAVSLNKKGKALTLGIAVGLWLLFMGITNFFEQAGLNGTFPTRPAVWLPLGIFSLLGLFLISKVKT